MELDLREFAGKDFEEFLVMKIDGLKCYRRLPLILGTKAQIRMSRFADESTYRLAHRDLGDSVCLLSVIATQLSSKNQFIFVSKWNF